MSFSGAALFISLVFTVASLGAEILLSKLLRLNTHELPPVRDENRAEETHELEVINRLSELNRGRANYE